MPANRVIRDGLSVGLIASVAVAAFYGVFDLLASRGMVYTVNLLGRSVFRGLRDPGVTGLPMTVDVEAIVWYSVLHLGLSLAIGVVVVGLVEHAERNPPRATLMAAIIVAGFFVTVFAVGRLTAPIRPVLPWWSIVVANGLATLLAGRHLVRRRPGLVGRLLPIAV